MRANNKFYNLGIIGNPINHSLSPIIHNFWLKQYKIKGNYTKFLISEDKLKDAIIGIKGLNIKGINVTIPHKERVIKYLDKIDVHAKKLGAVNTIINKKGQLLGTNTDGQGFISALEKKHKDLRKYNPVLIIGAGGAAKAIVGALVNEGIKEIRIMNRTKARAEMIMKRYNEVVFAEWLDSESWADVRLIVNTTCLGMVGFPDLKIKLRNTKNKPVIYDIVYNPLETSLIKEAKDNNLLIINGLGMLVGQAKESFNLWFDQRPKENKKLLRLISSELKSI